jgi:glucose/mannose transport system permease protein
MRRAGLAQISRYTVLLTVAAAFLIPLYVMVAASLRPLGEIRGGDMLVLPSAPSFAAWLKAWATACIGAKCVGLRPYYFNSFVITVPSVVLSVILGALNGYALTKWRLRGAETLFALLLVGCFVPFQILLIPMAQALYALGLFGSLPGLVLVHVVYGVPVTTLLFRNFYRSVPDEILRAARVDGAGFFAAFVHVLLPLSKPMLAVAAILQFTGIWNDFLFGVVFSDPGSAPVTVALVNLVGANFGVKEYNVDMAAAVLAATPTLIIYFCAGRWFLSGLTAGAVKG